uniref:hypothetical protein n=1 Tax=Cryptomonas gyropyrenoidosa TaxID=233257 RepID=UPI0027A98FB1|nr:hypothetical protein QLP26_pgp031 [Cryptomonas gyropyrenoidosa]WFQ83051.1 hypothetical protein [Cryptomonas gyropyrenoidosa]
MDISEHSFKLKLLEYKSQSKTQKPGIILKKKFLSNLYLKVLYSFLLKKVLSGKIHGRLLTYYFGKCKEQIHGLPKQEVYKNIIFHDSNYNQTIALSQLYDICNEN